MNLLQNIQIFTNLLDNDGCIWSAILNLQNLISDSESVNQET